MNLSLRSIRRNIAALSVVALIASMLVVSVAYAGSATNTYGDPDLAGSWYELDVDWGLDNGVLDSSQAYFRAGDNASRAEFFTMAARGAGIPEGTCDETLFPDLDASHWACGWVTGMADAGIVSGDGPTSPTPDYVRPDDPIVRAEAAKVVVEAYGLTGTGTLGSDVWTDSEVGSWYDTYMGIAKDNCVFQGVGGGNTVEPGRNIVRAEAIAVINRGANPTSTCVVTPPAGALTVSLDGSTPDGVSIPQNGANVSYSVFAFAASNDEDVNVTQVVVSREGLGLYTDFTNLKLYVDGVQKGSEKTVNSDNISTFNLTTDPIVVPAGKTVLVEVRAEMSGVSGSENQLCIAMAEDVTGSGATSGGTVDVTGSFSVCGELMVTTSATVGTVTYTVTQPSTADINVGDADVIMTKVLLDVSTEDVHIERVTFKQVGSAAEADFANVSLWMSGTQYADSSYTTWDGDFLTFDLSELPIAIAIGNSKTVELHVDVVGGLASTAAFDIYRDWHIEGTGDNYGYGVNVTETGGVSPSNRNIVGGNVAFSLSSNNPVTGDVKKGANEHEFTRFNVSTAGDGVTVRKISLTAVANAGNTDVTLANLDDVKIWTQDAFGDWYVVAGPNDLTGGASPVTVSFTDSFDVPAATTQEFMITGDIANAATLNDIYDIDVASVILAANTEVEYLSDGTALDVTTEVTGGTLNGNEMTVKVPTLTVALAATPGDKSYVRNTTDKDLVAFDMSASTADDLRVTSVVLSCTGAGIRVCSTAFQSLYLYEKDGSTLTVLDGPRSMAASGLNGTSTFSLNHTITSGSTARLLVRSDLSSSAGDGSYILNIAASGVTAEDTDSASATVTLTPGPNTANRTVTLAGNGTIADQNVSDTSLKSRMVASLSTDEPVLKLRFDASELEAWYVKKLEFELAVGADDTVSKLYVNYVDNLGDPQVASGTITSGLVNFEGLNIYVPAGGNQTIDISLDMGEVATGGATAGDLVQVLFDGNGGVVQAIGASSAFPDTVFTDITSNELRLAKSFPIVARTDLSTALANGEMTIYEMTVAADDAEDIAVKQLYFDVTSSGGLTNTNARLFKDGVLVSDSGDIDLLNAAGADVEAGTVTTAVVAQWSDGTTAGEDLIAAGTSTTYTLKMTVSGAVSGQSISTAIHYDAAAATGVLAAATGYTVGGTSSYFVWSDLSVSPHSSIVATSSADYLNGYLVDGLSAAGSQILSL